MPWNGFLPLIQLFLFGGFAVLSALLKACARVTALLGVTLAVLEDLSGMALMAATHVGILGDGFADGHLYCGGGGPFAHGPHAQGL